jgi:hypothetical protein
MMAYEGVKVQFHAYLISARNEETSCPGLFIPVERVPSIIEQED